MRAANTKTLPADVLFDVLFQQFVSGMSVERAESVLEVIFIQVWIATVTEFCGSVTLWLGC